MNLMQNANREIDSLHAQLSRKSVEIKQQLLSTDTEIINNRQSTTEQVNCYQIKFSNKESNFRIETSNR